jgi:membrane-associated phospholipid phosphatase
MNRASRERAAVAEESYSRVYVGAHFPRDVTIGLLIGAGVARHLAAVHAQLRGTPAVASDFLKLFIG